MAGSRFSGYEMYASLKLEEREITGTWAGIFCLQVTEAPFPRYMALAGKFVAGKDTMLEDRASEVAEKVMLPREHFLPPESDKAESLRTLATSPENPTHK
jgi:hypothetical protein